MGTEKIVVVGRGRQKSVSGWGVKISPQGGGQFEEKGGGGEGELSKKCQKTMLLCKISQLFCATRKKLKIS